MVEERMMRTPIQPTDLPAHLGGVLLRCPDCRRATIVKHEAALICITCSRTFQVFDHVVDLLPSDLAEHKRAEDELHISGGTALWRALVFQKASYIRLFERLWMAQVVNEQTRTFLELAGGLCYASALVKLRRPDVWVIASDISPRYLIKSQQVARFMEAKVDHFAAVDAECLPFDDQQFDAIFTGISMHHLPDIPAMLREVARVLRPGGLLLGVDTAEPALRLFARQHAKLKKRRTAEKGVLERHMTLSQWRSVLRRSGVPGTMVRLGPGFRLRHPWLRRLINLVRPVHVWVQLQKR